MFSPFLKKSIFIEHADQIKNCKRLKAEGLGGERERRIDIFN